MRLLLLFRYSFFVDPSDPAKIKVTFGGGIYAPYWVIKVCIVLLSHILSLFSSFSLPLVLLLQHLAPPPMNYIWIIHFHCYCYIYSSDWIQLRIRCRVQLHWRLRHIQIWNHLDSFSNSRNRPRAPRFLGQFYQIDGYWHVEARVHYSARMLDATEQGSFCCSKVSETIVNFRSSFSVELAQKNYFSSPSPLLVLTPFLFFLFYNLSSLDPPPQKKSCVFTF